MSVIPGATRKAMWTVPFTELTILPGLNIRTAKNYGDIEELAHQILKNGTSPMEVMRQGNKVIVKDGHRRHAAITWAASKNLLGLDTVYVDCYEEPADTTEQQRIIDMILHAAHQELTVLDEAEAYQRLTIFGSTPSDIATLLGKKTAYVSSRIKLLDAPQTVKDAINEGKLSATAALELQKMNPNEQQKIIAENPGGLRVSDVRKKAPTNISRQYMDDLYETVDANFDVQVDETGKCIIECLKAGIRLCKEEDVDLQQVINELRQMF